MRRLQFLAAGVAALLFLGTGLARAEEPKQPAAGGAEVDEFTQRVVDLEKQYKQHLSDLADDALKKDCKTALELAGQLADEKLKARALLVIGKILDGTNHDDVRIVAIKTIADSGAKELFRYVKQYLAQNDPKSVPPVLMDAIDCASKLKPDEAVVPMLSLEENSKMYTVNVAAMKALSNYGENKRYRAKIVKDLVDDIRKDRPGISYRWQGSQGVGSGGGRVKTNPRGIRTGEDSRNRYEALAGEMCTACNKLTGQNVAAPEDWFDLIEKYKTDLEALWGK